VKQRIDQNFLEVPPFPGLTRFPRGIEKVAIEGHGKFQGTEYRNIMKVNIKKKKKKKKKKKTHIF